MSYTYAFPSFTRPPRRRRPDGVLRLLQGGASKPPHPEASLAPPRALNTEARGHWFRWVTELRDRAPLTAHDRRALTELCRRKLVADAALAAFSEEDDRYVRIYGYGRAADLASLRSKRYQRLVRECGRAAAPFERLALSLGILFPGSPDLVFTISPHTAPVQPIIA